VQYLTAAVDAYVLATNARRYMEPVGLGIQRAFPSLVWKSPCSYSATGSCSCDGAAVRQEHRSGVRRWHAAPSSNPNRSRNPSNDQVRCVRKLDPISDGSQLESADLQPHSETCTRLSLPSGTWSRRHQIGPRWHVAPMEPAPVAVHMILAGWLLSVARPARAINPPTRPL